MWIVAGLGNPGREYAGTRHNAGFMVVEELAGRYSLNFKKRKDYLFTRADISGNDTVLIMPLTYMNRSGAAVSDLLKKTNADAGRLIVVHDDMDVGLGNLKIRGKGSPAGHKGVASVIEYTGTHEFIRIKIGIGRESRMPADGFVLGRFKRNELPAIREAVQRAADAIICIITDGVSKAMNKFNKSL